MKKLYFSLFLTLWASYVIAQQVVSGQSPIFSNYYSNQFIYNPAYIGSHGYGIANLHYRTQWTGLEGSPTTVLGTFDIPVESVGIGFKMYQDKAGMFSTTGTQFGLSYKMKMSKSNALSFGLGLGYILDEINWINMLPSDRIDPVLSSISSTVAVEGAFGIRYSSKKLDIGFSLPQMFSRSISVKGADNAALKYFSQTVTSVSYRFDLKSQEITIKPMVLYKVAKIDRGQIDANVIATWKEMLWAGILYRSNYGYGVTTGFRTGKLAISYAYDISTRGIGRYATSAHEITVSYHLRSLKQDKIVKEQQRLRDSIRQVRKEALKLKEQQQQATDSTKANKVDEKPVEQPIVNKPEEPETYQLSESFKSLQIGKSLILKEIYFKIGSSEMEQDSEEALKSLAQFLTDNPTAKVEISGHTDNIGNPKNNLILSQKRAEAVVFYLVKRRKIDKSRLVAKGYGDTRPVASNDDEEDGRELNRRIEVKLIEK
jgi:type IX secretion system PorP/SprF family membrane protein